MIFSILGSATFGEMTGSLAGYGRAKGSVETSLSSDGSTLTIKILGRFDFSLHEVFQRAYEEQGKMGMAFIIDLYSTDYLDSSALGMLLLMRENLGGERSNIRLMGGSDQIRKTLRIARFNQLFPQS